MSDSVSYEEVESLANRLSTEDRIRLAEKIARDLASSTPSKSITSDWMSLRGVAPDLLGGEDAQDWVSRTRRESDIQRNQG